MKTSTYAERGLWRANPLRHGANRSDSATAEGVLEFGRCRVLLRERRLLTDGVQVELGTRAFDLLLALLEADGALVTKEELLHRVWPGIAVSEENLKVQVAALRKALGADRDAIRTEFGRGYRFTGLLRANGAPNPYRCPRASGGASPRSLHAIPGSSPRRGGILRGPWSCRQSLWRCVRFNWH